MLTSSPAINLGAANALLLARINRVLFDYVQKIVSSARMAGETHRAPTLAFEGMEVAGTEEWDPSQMVAHLDLSAMGSAWPYALFNEELRVKRFEPVVEEEFVAVLDLSRSDRYPLRLLYEDRPIDADPSSLAKGKPSLIKLAAGALVALAADRGFPVRLVTFGPHGVDMGTPLRSAQEPLNRLFQEVDRRFAAMSRGVPVAEECQYEHLIALLERRRAMAVFVGDFMDPVYEWDDAGTHRRWTRMLSMFRDWATRRRVAIVRVNYSSEVMPPLKMLRRELPQVWNDRCDVQVETGKYRNEAHYVGYRDYDHHFNARLSNQQLWQALIAEHFSRTRAYVPLVSTTPPAKMMRMLRDAWLRLVG